MMRRLTPYLLLAVLFLGTGLGIGLGLAEAPAGGSLIRYTSAGLKFSYPSSWHERPFRVSSSFADFLMFLSNQTMHNPCRTLGTHSGTICRSPILKLDANGVLVQWVLGGMPGFRLAKQPGQHQVIGGLPSRVDTTFPGACSNIGADETIEVVASRGRDNFYGLTACIRGPNLRYSTAQVMALLRSTTFTDNK
jgi:hypothetical protein